MKAKKLNKAEKDWIAKLQAVLDEKPTNRLACYTTGDHTLHFYDRYVSDEWIINNPNVALDARELHERAGSALTSISGELRIDSCQG